MKHRHFFPQSIMIFCLLMISGILYAREKENEKRQHYDIAAFVWPSYHPDDRAKIFWPDGIGEWQTVKNNEAKFKGHEQPRYPLWGYTSMKPIHMWPKWRSVLQPIMGLMYSSLTGTGIRDAFFGGTSE